MRIWQADFYRRPLQDESGQSLWELLICDPKRQVEWSAFCPQSEANAAWLETQLQQLVEQQGLPDRIQVFRPQSLSLLEIASNKLGIAVEPTRHTPALKQWLQERATEYPNLSQYTQQPYTPTQLDQPPPLPLPENLWGEQWRFASLPAGDLIEAFTGRMIPILEIPDAYQPIRLGIASTTPIPGVVIDGGRQSMKLARWLQEVCPVEIRAMSGQPDGLILEAGLVDRWIVATFEDPEVAISAQEFEKRKHNSQGLHFLLVQPDDSGMTYSGFWLLNGLLDRKP
jgi:hypothetical protein